MATPQGNQILEQSNSDKTANITFVDERKKDEAEIHTHGDVHSKDTSKDIAENQWSINNILTREYPIARFEWKVSHKKTDDLFRGGVPKLIFDSNNAMLTQQLKLFAFFRAGVKIRIQVNGTKFHSGVLIAYMEVPLWNHDSDKTYYHEDNRVCWPHILLDASTSNSGEITIPFVSMLTHFSQQKGTLESSSMNTLGQLIIQPLNPLRAADESSQVISGTIYASFISPEVHHPTLPVEFEYGTGYVQGLESLMKKGAGALIDSGLGIADKFTGGLVTGVGDALSSILGLGDKPSDPVAAPPMINRAVDSLCHGAGLDRSIRLGLSPTALSNVTASVVGSTSSDFDLKTLAQIPSILETVEWKATDPVGKQVAEVLLCPTYIPDSRKQFLKKKTCAVYSPTMLAYVSRPNCLWRGSLMVKLQVVSTIFQSGRLYIVLDSHGTTDFNKKDFEDHMNHNLIVMDLEEKKEIVVKVPFMSVRPWLRCDRFRSLQNLSPNSETREKIFLGESTIGFMKIYVANTLVRPNNVPDTVDINIYMYAGEDFELSIPNALAPLDVSPPGEPTFEYAATPAYPYCKNGSGLSICNNRALIYDVYMAGARLLRNGMLKKGTSDYWYDYTPVDVAMGDEQVVWSDQVNRLKRYLEENDPCGTYMKTLAAYKDSTLIKIGEGVTRIEEVTGGSSMNLEFVKTKVTEIGNDTRALIYRTEGQREKINQMDNTVINIQRDAEIIKGGIDDNTTMLRFARKELSTQTQQLTKLDNTHKDITTQLTRIENIQDGQIQMDKSLKNGQDDLRARINEHARATDKVKTDTGVIRLKQAEIEPYIKSAEAIVADTKKTLAEDHIHLGECIRVEKWPEAEPTYETRFREKSKPCGDENSMTAQGLEEFVTPRDEEGEPITITHGATSKSVAPITISENAMNLQTVLRRYYPLFVTREMVNDVGFTLIAVPVNPMLTPGLIHTVGGVGDRTMPMNNLAWYSRLFTYWRGSTRYKFVFNINESDIYCWHNPVEAKYFSITSGVTADLIQEQMSFAGTAAVTRVQQSIEVEVPYYSAFNQLLLDAHHARNDLRAQNGTLFVAIRNRGHPISISTFISTGEDFLLNILKSPPNVFEASRNPYTDSEPAEIVQFPELSRRMGYASQNVQLPGDPVFQSRDSGYFKPCRAPDAPEKTFTATMDPKTKTITIPNLDDSEEIKFPFTFTDLAKVWTSYSSKSPYFTEKFSEFLAANGEEALTTAFNKYFRPPYKVGTLNYWTDFYFGTRRRRDELMAHLTKKLKTEETMTAQMFDVNLGLPDMTMGKVNELLDSFKSMVDKLENGTALNEVAARPEVTELIEAIKSIKTTGEEQVASAMSIGTVAMNLSLTLVVLHNARQLVVNGWNLANFAGFGLATGALLGLNQKNIIDICTKAWEYFSNIPGGTRPEAIDGAMNAQMSLTDFLVEYKEKIVAAMAAFCTFLYSAMFGKFPKFEELKKKIVDWFEKEAEPEVEKMQAQSFASSLKEIHFATLGFTALEKVFNRFKGFLQEIIEWWVGEESPAAQAARILDGKNDEILVWLRELEELEDNEVLHEALTDPFYHSKYFKMMDKGEEFLKFCMKNKVPPMLTSIVREGRKQAREVVNRLKEIRPQHGFRYAPFTVCFTGSTGTGKSTLMNKVRKLIARKLDLPNYNLVYSMPAKDEFMSGYEGQPILEWDDVGQNTDQDSMLSEFINWVSNADVRLNMPGLPGKGMFFTSKAIIMSTNITALNTNKIREIEAFRQRRHVLIQVERRQGLTLEELRGLQNDPEHGFATFTLLDSSNNRPVRRNMTYGDVMELITERHTAWHLKQLEMMETYFEENESMQIPKGVIAEVFEDAAEEDVMAAQIGEIPELEINPDATPQEKFEAEVFLTRWRAATIDVKVGAYERHIQKKSLFSPENRKILATCRETLVSWWKKLTATVTDFYNNNPVICRVFAALSASGIIFMVYSGIKGFIDPEAVAENAYESGPLKVTRVVRAENAYESGPVKASRVVRAENAYEAGPVKGVKLMRAEEFVAKLVSIEEPTNDALQAQRFAICIPSGEGKTTLCRKYPDVFCDADEHITYGTTNIPRVKTILKGVGAVAGTLFGKDPVEVFRRFYKKNQPDSAKILLAHHPSFTDRVVLGSFMLPEATHVRGNMLCRNMLTTTEHEIMDYDERDARIMDLIQTYVPTLLENGTTEEILTPEMLRAEGTNDTVACEVARGKAHPSLHHILWVKDGKMSRLLGAMVGGKMILAPYHFFYRAKDGERFYVVRGEVQIEIEFQRKNLQQIREKDACLYFMGPQMASRKSLLNCFLKESELTRVTKTDALLLGLNERGAETEKSFRAIGNTQQKYLDGAGTQFVQNGWTYPAHTLPGECGSLLILCEPSLPPPARIAGIHTAGFNQKIGGFSTLITREMIAETVTALEARVGKNVTGMPIDKAVKTDDACLAQMRICPEGDYSIYGVMPANLAPAQPRQTTLMPTPFQGEAFEVTRKPAMLTPRNGISPLKNALGKYGRKTKPFAQSDIDAVIADMAAELKLKLPSNFGKIVFDEEAAIFGRDGVAYVDRMNMQTSEGWPLQCRRPIGVSGKAYLFDMEKHTIANEELRRRVDHRLAEAKEGRRVASIWRDCLKDELRPVAKADAGKTRLFTIGPCDFTILCRQYFMDFEESFYKHNCTFFSAVGINPESYEWTVLYNYLAAMSTEVIAGDYGTFDGTLMAQLIAAAGEVMNRWYEDSEENQMVRRVLIDEMIHTMQVVENCVYSTHQGNPSGNPLTVIINTLVNAMYMRICWRRLAPDGKKSMFFYHKNVREICYGDDNILAVKREAQSFFNQVTITAVLAEHGIEYTDEGKTGNIVPIRRLQDVTFLKRGFATLPAFGSEVKLPTMSKDTIQSFFHWYRKSPDVEEQLRTNMQCALGFAFYHGEDYYRVIEETYSRVMASHGFEPVRITYDDWVDIFYSVVNGTAKSTLPEFGYKPLKEGQL
nr:hypothetical protein [Leuven Picorna-like virus 5]